MIEGAVPPLERLDTRRRTLSNGGNVSILSSPVSTTIQPATVQPSNTISRKVNQVAAISSSLGENEQLRTALQYLGTFYNENSINERRNLRGVLERKTLETHKELFKEFSKVNEQLELLDKVVGDLNKTCNLIDEQIREHESKTKPFLNHINSLNHKLQETQHRQELISNFLTQFQLTDTERDALLHHPITPNFFRTLNKVHDIYSACTEMLRSHQQKSGLEIMEEMSGYQDTAYERLSRWTQEKCRLLSSDIYSNIDMDDEENLFGHLLVEEELKHALTALSERPVLLKCCLKEIVTARKMALLSRFFDALHGSKGRPIEMVAHDPVRYIGDILAWIHQSAANERELIDSLLSLDDEHAEPDSKKQMLAFNILNEIFETLNKDLKMRIDQILNGEEVDIIIYFKLGHFLELYSNTVSKMLGKNSSFPMYLLELKSLVTKKFFQVLQKELEIVTNSPLVVTDDLRPPELFIQTLHKLTDIMNTFSESVVPEQRREEEFSMVLNAIIDPLLQTLQKTLQTKMNNEKNEDRISDLFIFIINSHFALHRVLVPHSFTSKKVEQVMGEIDKIMEDFITFQSNRILKGSGIAEKLELMKNHAAPFCRVPGLTQENMTNFMRDLYHQLFNLSTQLLNPQHQCDRITAPRLQVYARNRIATALSDAYAKIYAAIDNPINEYTNPREFAYHTPQQVKTLLE